MCMGMMNYRESEDNLTFITCKGCNRTWQTNESAAKQFEEQYGSLCNACRNKSKETVSLLKRKTNNDRINEMSVEEKAKAISNKCGTACPLHSICHITKASECISNIKQWLESEAEE